jgi:hypothetical protein
MLLSAEFIVNTVAERCAAGRFFVDFAGRAGKLSDGYTSVRRFLAELWAAAGRRGAVQRISLKGGFRWAVSSQGLDG